MARAVCKKQIVKIVEAEIQLIKHLASSIEAGDELESVRFLKGLPLLCVQDNVGVPGLTPHTVAGMSPHLRAK